MVFLGSVAPSVLVANLYGALLSADQASGRDDVSWVWVVGILIGIVAFFSGREFKKYDREKDRSEEKYEAFNELISSLSTSLEKLKITVDDLSNLHQDINNIQSELHELGRDHTRVRHEIQLLAEIQKPLFDLKTEIGKDREEMAKICDQLDEIKDKIHGLEKEILLLRKEE